MSHDKLIIEYLTGSRYKFLRVPLSLWGIIILANLLGTCHLLFIMNVRDVEYIALGWIVWISFTVLLYPSIEFFFQVNESNKFRKYEMSVFNVLQKIYSEQIRWEYNVKNANRSVVKITIILWIIWIVGLIWINKKVILYRIAQTIPFITIWLFVFSALHYVLSLGYFVYVKLREDNIDNFKINRLILEIALSSKNPMHSFMKFKQELEGIFNPFISIILRTLSLMALILLGLSTFKLWASNVPVSELKSLMYSMYLILGGTVMSLLVVLYITIKLSVNLKEILLVEVKEAKIQLSELDSHRANEIIEEIEDIISNIKLIFIPPKDVIDIIGTLLAILVAILGI